MKYVCELCGYVYDEAQGLPKKGIAPGTAFSDLPEHFECPGCFSEKQAFDPVKEPSRPSAAGSSATPVIACTDAKQTSEK